MIPIIGLFMLAAALCGGAIYGYLGYYWSEYRRVLKDARRNHWKDNEK